MSEKIKAYLYIHISVFLWGFTAILGKLITLSEIPLVWYRILFTVPTFLLLPKVFCQLRQLTRKNILTLGAVGCLIVIHWICFYGSIKVANASIALCCLSLTAFITSIAEPIIRKKSFSKADILFGLLVIPGIVMIFHFESQYVVGIVLGLFAALFSSLFGICNKTMISKGIGEGAVSFVELGLGWLILTCLLPLLGNSFKMDFNLGGSDLIYLLLLAVVCTTIPFILSLKALKQLSAFTVSFSLNLEPVYGFVLAALYFKEHQQFHSEIMIPLINISVKSFYLGAGYILAIVFLNAFMSIKRKPNLT